MMVAASTACGSRAIQGAASSTSSAKAMAVNAPAQRVRAPASKATPLRAKPPVTGMPPLRPATRLAAPRPSSSRRGRMRSPRRAASACATARLST